MNLRVRFSTDLGFATAFARAMDFWAGVLDMEWYEERGKGCALAVIDGKPELFKPAEAARAQFPNMPEFQGWIALNPEISLSQTEKYTMAVHELRHVFGLSHSVNPSSVMYFLCLEEPLFLDITDLEALATRHKLRAGHDNEPLQVDDPAKGQL